MAWRLEGEALVQGEPGAMLPAGRVYALVGGGGKTTLAHQLAAHFRDAGKRAAVLTTTRMGLPECPCLTMDDCRAAWAEGAYAVCGRMEDGHFRMPEAAFLAQLLAEADVLLTESDGARRKPCKAPADHEPVLLPQTDVILTVMGADALGQPVEAICHRPERVQAILGCDGAHRLTPADLAMLLLSPQGSRKGAEGRRCFAVLNKCDDDARRARGADVLRLLRARGADGMLTAFARRSEQFEQPGK